MRPPRRAGKATVMPAFKPLAREQQRPVGGDLVRVAAAVGGGHAADARDAHREDVRAGGGLLGGGLAGGRSCRPRRRLPWWRRWAAAPPGLAAPAGAASRRAESSTAARKRLPRWKAWIAGGRLFAKKIPSRRKPDCLEPAAIDLSRCACTNRAAGGKLRRASAISPSESLAEGAGASGLEGRPGGGSGRLKPAGATSLGASAWNSEARYWICPRPTPSSDWPPP